MIRVLKFKSKYGQNPSRSRHCINALRLSQKAAWVFYRNLRAMDKVRAVPAKGNVNICSAAGKVRPVTFGTSASAISQELFL